jgi:hypothetical protein
MREARDESTVTTSAGWLGQIGSVIGAGVMALVRTVLWMAGLGIVLGIVCGFIAYNGSMARGAVVGVLALLVCIVAAFPMGFHRAVTRTLVEALRRTKLANAIISALFQRLLKINESDAHGQRGTQTAQAIEGLTVVEFEKEADRGLVELLKVQASGGGIRGAIIRRVHAKLMSELRRTIVITSLGSLGPDGKVDLARVRESSTAYAHEMVESHILGTSAKLTTFVVVVACIVLPVAAYLFRQVSVGWPGN